MSPPAGRHPQFAPVHEPLHTDVSYLGELLGRVLREHEGDEFFECVEKARRACIERRSNGDAAQTLVELFSGLPVERVRTLVQAFSVYFSLTNLAEQVHRIRRRRDYQASGRA